MPRPALPDLVAALPNFLLAGTAILTWYNPTVLGVGKVSYFVALMLLEFIVLHSAAFMGNVAYGKEPKVGRVTGILGLAFFYTLFAGGVALAFHRMWPLWAFWTLVLNRLAGVLMGQGGDDGAAEVVRAGWAAGMVFYLVATFLTLLLPLPRLGITPAVVDAQHFTASGLWVEQPWRALAMAAVYYTLQGVSTLKAHGWVQRKPTNTPLSTNVERGDAPTA